MRITLLMLLCAGLWLFSNCRSTGFKSKINSNELLEENTTVSTIEEEYWYHPFFLKNKVRSTTSVKSDSSEKAKPQAKKGILAIPAKIGNALRSIGIPKSANKSQPLENTQGLLLGKKTRRVVSTNNLARTSATNKNVLENKNAGIWPWLFSSWRLGIIISLLGLVAFKIFIFFRNKKPG